MGLIDVEKDKDSDSRPRDWAYKAVFSQKDFPSLQKMARHIRETHDVSMIEDFNLKCEQKLAGQTAAVVLDNGIEIQSVTKTGDLVVNAGLQQCINLILGTSSTRWTHFGMSPGNIPAPAVTDTSLYENAAIIAYRVTLAWGEPAGMRLYFGGISSQTDPNAPSSVGEIGVYNGSAAGAVLLNRSLFPANAPKQQKSGFGDIFTAPIVVSAVIEFCPVV